MGGRVRLELWVVSVYTHVELLFYDKKNVFVFVERKKKFVFASDFFSF